MDIAILYFQINSNELSDTNRPENINFMIVKCIKIVLITVTICVVCVSTVFSRVPEILCTRTKSKYKFGNL